MKRSLLISVAALAVACGGASRHADTRDNGVSSKTATPSGAAPGAMQRADAAASNAAAPSNQLVTLIGCLKRSAAASPTGTSGTPARARAGGPETAAADTSVGITTEVFMLVDATPASPDSAGVGTNGAGASGGPLVSGKSSFELDGIPAEARAHVNATVRVVGRLDANSLTTSTQDAAGGNAIPPSLGATAATAGAGSNGSNVATKTADARRLVVERVEVVSQSCER